MVTALLATACAPDPYAWIAVVSVSPDHVTVRYTEGGAPDPLRGATALAEAQCADLGRRASFQWDIELVSEDGLRGPATDGSRDIANLRLRKLGYHQVHFLCVEP